MLILTHFQPTFLFYTQTKLSENSGFAMFLGRIQKKHLLNMNYGEKRRKTMKSCKSNMRAVLCISVSGAKISPGYGQRKDLFSVLATVCWHREISTHRVPAQHRKAWQGEDGRYSLDGNSTYIKVVTKKVSGFCLIFCVFNTLTRGTH